jgi:hypothetical protein
MRTPVRQCVFSTRVTPPQRGQRAPIEYLPCLARIRPPRDRQGERRFRNVRIASIVCCDPGGCEVGPSRASETFLEAFPEGFLHASNAYFCPKVCAGGRWHGQAAYRFVAHRLLKPSGIFFQGFSSSLEPAVLSRFLLPLSCFGTSPTTSVSGRPSWLRKPPAIFCGRFFVLETLGKGSSWASWPAFRPPCVPRPA